MTTMNGRKRLNATIVVRRVYPRGSLKQVGFKGEVWTRGSSFAVYTSHTTSEGHAAVLAGRFVKKFNATSTLYVLDVML